MSMILTSLSDVIKNEDEILGISIADDLWDNLLTPEGTPIFDENTYSTWEEYLDTFLGISVDPDNEYDYSPYYDRDSEDFDRDMYEDACKELIPFLNYSALDSESGEVIEDTLENLVDKANGDVFGVSKKFGFWQITTLAHYNLMKYIEYDGLSFKPCKSRLLEANDFGLVTFNCSDSVFPNVFSEFYGEFTSYDIFLPNVLLCLLITQEVKEDVYLPFYVELGNEYYLSQFCHHIRITDVNAVKLLLSKLSLLDNFNAFDFVFTTELISSLTGR